MKEVALSDKLLEKKNLWKMNELWLRAVLWLAVRAEEGPAASVAVMCTVTWE